jgi:hypothetical protein
MDTSFYDLADENFRKACYNLGHRLGNLLAQCLLYHLVERMLKRSGGLPVESDTRTFLTACFGNACLLYASKRSYCSGLKLSINTLLKDNE